MRRALTQLVYRVVLSPARLVFFRVFRPKTHGVKVVIRDELSGEILVVRHCYGNTAIWHVPGGGYRPRRESAEQAARREIREELSLELDDLVHLGDYWTNRRGNRDTVQIFAATVRSPAVRPGHEIAEHRWASPEVIAGELPVYRGTRHALSLLDRRVQSGLRPDVTAILPSPPD